MTTLTNEDPADPSVHEPTPASHIHQNRKALTSSLPIVLDAIVELYCYWPDGSRKYMSFDHWPQRDELPADAVRFDFAVPDPDFSECQIPPMGWRCTRSEGHEGPCAAVEAPEDAALVASAMQRLRGA